MPPTIRASSSGAILRPCFLLLVLLCASAALLLDPHRAEAALTLAKPPNNLGLVGYWSFNEGTSTVATDFSGNGNHGTLSTNGGSIPVWTNGKRGKALFFNSSDSYVNAGTGSSLSVSGAVTVCAWFDGEFPVDRMIVANANASNANGQYYLEVFGGGNLSFGWSDSTPNYELAFTAAGVVEENTWQHGCGVRSAGGVGAVYLNGVDRTDTNSGSVTPPSSPGGITAIGRTGSADLFYWDGAIDEVRVYNRALSPTEVARLYNTGLVKTNSSSASLDNGSSLESGLIAHWTFDGGDTTWTSSTAGSTRNRAASGNDGTLTNMNRGTLPAIGKLGQAFSFNASTDRISAGDLTGTDTQSKLTWSFWVYQTTLGDQEWYVGKGNPNAQTQMSWAIFNESNGFDGAPDTIQVAISSALGSSDVDDSCLASTATILLNEWMHVAVVYDGTLSGNENRVNIYRNGINHPITACLGTFPAVTTNSSANVTIGDTTDQTRNINNVRMDDIRIYQRALSPAEVQQLYKLGTVRITQ